MVKKFKLFILVFIVALVIPILMPTTNKNVKAYTNNDIVFYGNDISKWQGEVDFTKMQAVSDFVIIRVGYGTKIDENFITYMQNALKTKINVGVYLYSIASTLQEVVNEANWLVSILQENGFDDGDLTFPVYFDYEEISFIQSKTKKENTDIINAFANAILNAGFYPGVYMSASSFNSYVNADDLVCDVWIANYFGSNNVSEFSAKYNNSHSRVKMWQYADGPYASGGTSISSHLKSTVEDHGVSSEYIDENFCFVDYPSIIKSGGYNGHKASGNSSSSAEKPSSSITNSSSSSSNQQISSNNQNSSSQNSTSSSLESSKSEPISSSNGQNSSSSVEKPSSSVTNNSSSNQQISSNNQNGSSQNSTSSSLENNNQANGGKKGGCKSSLGGSMILSLLAIGAVSVIKNKKRK